MVRHLVFVKFHIKLHIYCITVSKHTKDVYYYVISSLLTAKHWKIGHAKVFIQNHVPAVGS